MADIVYVLTDTAGVIYGVITDFDTADAWSCLSPDFDYTAVELDNYDKSNAIVDDLNLADTRFEEDM